MLVFSNVAADNYFASALDHLGIADAVKDKVVRANPGDVIARVVEGNGRGCWRAFDDATRSG